MGIEIPGYLQWVSYLAGEKWPEGDETAMRRIGDAWTSHAGQLRDIIPELEALTQDVKDVIVGESAQAIEDEFVKMFSGDYAVAKLADGMEGLGKLADATALQIEYSKYSIIGTLAVAAAEIIWAVASSWATGGGSLGLIPIAQAIARLAIALTQRELRQLIMRRLAQSLTTSAIRQLVSHSGGRIAIAAVKEAIQETAQGVGQELAVQGLQIAQGNRDGYDRSQLGATTWQSALGGALGGGTHATFGATTNRMFGEAATRADGAIRGGVGGYLSGLVGNGGTMLAAGGEFSAAGFFGGAATSGISSGIHGSNVQTSAGGTTGGSSPVGAGITGAGPGATTATGGSTGQSSGSTGGQGGSQSVGSSSVGSSGTDAGAGGGTHTATGDSGQSTDGSSGSGGPSDSGHTSTPQSAGVSDTGSGSQGGHQGAPTAQTATSAAPGDSAGHGSPVGSAPTGGESATGGTSSGSGPGAHAASPTVGSPSMADGSASGPGAANSGGSPVSGAAPSGPASVDSMAPSSGTHSDTTTSAAPGATSGSTVGSTGATTGPAAGSTSAPSTHGSTPTGNPSAHPTAASTSGTTSSATNPTSGPAPRLVGMTAVADHPASSGATASARPVGTGLPIAVQASTAAPRVEMAPTESPVRVTSTSEPPRTPDAAGPPRGPVDGGPPKPPTGGDGPPRHTGNPDDDSGSSRGERDDGTRDNSKSDESSDDSVDRNSRGAQPLSVRDIDGAPTRPDSRVDESSDDAPTVILFGPSLLPVQMIPPTTPVGWSANPSGVPGVRPQSQPPDMAREDGPGRHRKPDGLPPDGRPPERVDELAKHGRSMDELANRKMARESREAHARVADAVQKSMKKLVSKTEKHVDSVGTKPTPPADLGHVLLATPDAVAMVVIGGGLLGALAVKETSARMKGVRESVRRIFGVRPSDADSAAGPSSGRHQAASHVSDPGSGDVRAESGRSAAELDSLLGELNSTNESGQQCALQAAATRDLLNSGTAHIPESRGPDYPGMSVKGLADLLGAPDGFSRTDIDSIATTLSQLGDRATATVVGRNPDGSLHAVTVGTIDGELVVLDPSAPIGDRVVGLHVGLQGFDEMGATFHDGRQSASSDVIRVTHPSSDTVSPKIFGDHERVGVRQDGSLDAMLSPPDRVLDAPRLDPTDARVRDQLREDYPLPMPDVAPRQVLGHDESGKPYTETRYGDPPTETIVRDFGPRAVDYPTSDGGTVTVFRHEQQIIYPPNADGDVRAVSRSQVGDNVARTETINGRHAATEGVIRHDFGTDRIDRDADRAEKAATRRVGREGVDPDGRSPEEGGRKYAGGHVIGYRTMLDRGLVNLFSQEVGFNGGAYKSMENAIADWAASGVGREAEVVLRTVPPGIGTPDFVIGRARFVDAVGNLYDTIPIEFPNDKKSTFDRDGKGGRGLRKRDFSTFTED